VVTSISSWNVRALAGVSNPAPDTASRPHQGHFVINSRSDAQKGLKCHQIGQPTEGRLDVVQDGTVHEETGDRSNVS
jgi:hypothetical protein